MTDQALNQETWKISDAAQKMNMAEDSISHRLGELQGLATSAAAERNMIFSKLTSIESAAHKVDIVNANLENMRHDYHDRFGQLQTDYGEFSQALKDLEKRLNLLEDANMLAGQRLSIGKIAAMGIWAIFLTVFGGVVTIIVEWWTKHI